MALVVLPCVPFCTSVVKVVLAAVVLATVVLAVVVLAAVVLASGEVPLSPVVLAHAVPLLSNAMVSLQAV